MPENAREARHRQLASISQRYGLKLVYLFGSQSDLGKQYFEGEGSYEGSYERLHEGLHESIHPELSDPLADLDIGVVLLRREMPPLERVDLYSTLSIELQDLFQPFSVDLVLLEESHSVLQAEAICGHCILSENEKLRETYEERILARAADFKPFLDLFHRERLEETYDKPYTR